MKSTTTPTMSVLTVLSWVIILTLCTATLCLAEKKQGIPDVLKPWKSWVLYGKDHYACPRACSDSEDFFCVWPEILDLDFTDSGGTFKQKLTAFSSGPVPLPGDKTLWPLSVTVDGEAAPVLLRNGRPCVDLDEGSHTLSGRFTWNVLPVFFPVPEHTALISLRVNGAMQASTAPDSDNRLWVGKKDRGIRPDQNKDADSLTVSLFRLITDDHPMTVESRMELSVSGSKRREKLRFSLPEPARVMSITSPLPVRLCDDGTLWADVKAGTWTVTIMAMVNAPVSDLGPLKTPYGEEIWSFKPRSELRIVRIDGVQAVDPAQISMPDEWKSLSAYRITDNAHIALHETQRGCTDQSPDTVSLSRELWLDFDGRGATARDYISGTLGMRRFLSMDDREYALGRLSSGNKDQLITRFSDLSQGIELERGDISLEAVSRLKHPVSGHGVSLGWNSDYQTADLTVNLPPGWTMLGVRGGTAESGSTLLNQWSMLDLFLILIVSYGALKLWNPLWGLVFLCGLVLIRHESLSPFYVLAVLILTTALIRFKPGADGTQSKILNVVRGLVLGILVIHSALFAVAQVRTAAYPQLDPWVGQNVDFDRFAPKPAMMMPSPEPYTDTESRMMETVEEPALEKMMPMTRTVTARKKTYRLSSENIITQTGPAIPDWEGNSLTIHLGEVPQSHKLSLWLVSPAQNSVLALVRVVLILVMMFRVLPIRFRPRTRHTNRHETALCLALVSAALMLAGPRTVWADIPSSQLLTELEQRLTEAPECIPDCAALSDLTLILPDETPDPTGKQFIRMDFTVNAAIQTAIPLPSGQGTWDLYDMTLDDTPHLAVSRKNQDLWTLVPQGVHRISLRGLAFGQDRFRFVFPLRPALIRVQADHWDILGRDQNMQADNGLMATRKTAVDAQGPEVTAGLEPESPETPLTDGVRVIRALSLDREWTVTTTVERLTGSNDKTNVLITLPLLNDETVRTDLPGLTLSQGMAQVSLAPGRQTLSWVSGLPITDSLSLSVPADASWSETWNIDLSSRWHLTAQGPPRSCPDQGGRSSWHPWPGERLTVSLAQLEPAAGDFFTIDSADVDYFIEKGSNRVVLSSRLRTSQGRSISIPTPDNCIVKNVRVDGREFPVSGTPETLEIPLSPGAQTLSIEWNEADTWDRSFIERFIKPAVLVFPGIDLGKDSANIRMTMHLPDNSWLVYTHGPAWGPAILAWGLCGLILIAAQFLGRLPLSPLGATAWTLLGLGLISLSIPQILLVAGWFLVLELRKNRSPVSPLLFNTMQIALAVWTACVVFALYQAVSTGLLHTPDMQITGNGSTDGLLIWTQDRISGRLPSPWAAVYSAQTYHVLMLAWSLWLAIHLIPWSRHAVSALKSDGWFRPFFNRGKRKLK